MTTPVRSFIVRTCVAISGDVEPSTLPAIPKGTYGIATTGFVGEAGDFDPVDFGPPWGIQHVGNHTLVDAPAVLGNAKRAITLKRRPWRNVIRRTLKGFAGPYLLLVVARRGFYGDEDGVGGGSTWPVEAFLYRHGTKKKALALLDAAIGEAQGRPGRNMPRSIWEAELETMAKRMQAAKAEALRAAMDGHNEGRGVWTVAAFRSLVKGTLAGAPQSDKVKAGIARVELAEKVRAAVKRAKARAPKRTHAARRGP